MDALANFFDTHRGFFAIAGAASCSFIALKIILHILKAVRTFFLAPIFNLGVNPAKLGSWAVVTGSTDGIGKAYAIALAKKGMNIVLISRTPSKLKATAEEIEAVAKVQTKCVAVDFSGDVEIYDDIEEELKDLDIGILVNNVGMSYGYPQYFHQVSDREELFGKLLRINTFSVTFMTSMVLPRMVEKRKGAIVNIGSASCFGFPLLTVYAASKAFVDSFSKNLAVEYSDKGIIVQSVLPAFVATNMSGIRKTSTFIPTPEQYVKSAVATIGIESTTIGYWSHWLMISLYKFVITNISAQWMGRRVRNMMEKRRDVVLRRKAAGQKSN